MIGSQRRVSSISFSFSHSWIIFISQHANCIMCVLIWPWQKNIDLQLMKMFVQCVIETPNPYHWLLLQIWFQNLKSQHTYTCINIHTSQCTSTRLLWNTLSALIARMLEIDGITVRNGGVISWRGRINSAVVQSYPQKIDGELCSFPSTRVAHCFRRLSKVEGARRNETIDSKL